MEWYAARINDKLEVPAVYPAKGFVWSAALLPVLVLVRWPAAGGTVSGQGCTPAGRVRRLLSDVLISYHASAPRAQPSVSKSVL